VCRYPDDPYDRIWSWYQYDATILTDINTNKNITQPDIQPTFEAPISVLQTALTPISSPVLTTIIYDVTHPRIDNSLTYDVVLYLAELQNLSLNQSRVFNISRDGNVEISFVKPEYLVSSYTYDWYTPSKSSPIMYSLIQVSNSTLPPILNAMEVYWEMHMELNQLTNADDGKKSFLLIVEKITFLL
jgi:Malectin-like domain